MKQFISCLLFLFFVPGFLYAQFVPTYKWGKVLPEEIQLKVCPIDSTAPAVILSDYGKVIFGYGEILIERHKRIKILDRKGFSEGTIAIPYYTKDQFEKITQLQAHTITIGQNGNVVTQKVSANQIFEVDLANKWREKRFTFPNVEEGAILEYRYITVSHNYYTLDGWNFQSSIPTLFSEFHVDTPTNLNYRILLQGQHLTKKYEGVKTTTWSLNNLPALVKEKFIANPQDYAEKISFQLDVFNISGSVPVSFENHSNYFSQKEHAKHIIKLILAENETDLEKVKKIYNYVKNTFTWDGSYSIISSQNLSSLVETKKGNTADINLYLISLLKEAGLQANPVLFSTRSHGKIYANKYPLLTQFNHLAAFVQIKDEPIIMNASDRFRPYTLLDKNDLTENAYLLEPQSPRWIKIHQPMVSRQFTSAELDLSNIYSPVYRFSTRYDGYLALNQRQKYIEADKKIEPKQILSTSSQDFKLNHSEAKNMENSDEPLIIDLIYQLDNSSENQKEIMYFSPVLMSDFSENPFINIKRSLPVELDYPATYTYKLNAKLPVGYAVQGLPENTMIKLPNNMGEFRYQIIQKEGEIQLLSVVAMKASIIPAEFYHHLREFYDHIIAKYQEPVVIIKQK